MELQKELLKKHLKKRGLTKYSMGAEHYGACLDAVSEALTIPDVVGQNEQLFAFGEHLQKHFGCFLSTEHLQQEIDVFKGKKLPTTPE